MQQEKRTNTVDRPYAVSYVSGQVAANGQSVVLRIETAEDKPIELAVAMPDIQYLTTLLLLLSDKAVKLANTPAVPRPLQMIPVPLRSLSLAESEDGDTLLVLEVGGSTLAVALPPEVMSDVGRSLLMMGAARPAAVS